MSKKETSAIKVEVKNTAKSQVEITVSVPKEEWMKHRQAALKNINDSISLDGFRKGMIPENILIAKVGEMALLEEVAEIAISRIYVDILVEKKIDAIGKPIIKVTKLAKDNPLEFIATTAIIPEISLPDYKKIAAEEISKPDPNETKVTNEEIEDAILRIRKSRVSHEGHNHDSMTPEEHEKQIMENLPELNDQFVKSLGSFETVEDFREKISEMLQEEKKNSANEKRRINIADKILEKTVTEIPDLMIDSELKRTELQFKDDIERMGVKIDDYLKHAKKTIDELRKDWRPHAEKKAKLQLTLNTIAQKENLHPSKEEVEKEVNHIVEHYKDADRERASVYTETILTNEKVFQFLENTKKQIK